MHRSLEFLLDHLPPALHLVLASRSDPPLPLARLRARGQLVEFRAARPAVHPRRSRRTAAHRRRRTTCPTASSRRSASAPRAGPRAAPGRALAAGPRRRQPVRRRLLRQPPLRAGLPHRGGAGRPARRLRTFLLETSILDRLSGPLCDAVVGRPDGQQLLESVEQANLFLLPLDEERRWWRYHHLFADLLRANLQAQFPDRVPELHRAASAWYEQHGLPEEAIRHALAAGDTRRGRRRSSRSTSRSRSGGAPRVPRSPRGSPRSPPRRSTAGRC